MILCQLIYMVHVYESYNAMLCKSILLICKIERMFLNVVFNDDALCNQRKP